MNALSMDAQGRYHRFVFVASLAVLLASARDSRASSLIRSQVVPNASAAVQANLSTRAIVRAAMDRRIASYYQRALDVRSTHVLKLPGLQRFLVANEDGTLESNAVTQYLTWRRSLNTIRFDANHPGISQILRNHQLAQVTPTTPSIPEVVTPDDDDDLPPVVITTNPNPQVPIPEPSTLVIGIVLAGSCVWYHRRRRTG